MSTQRKTSADRAPIRSHPLAMSRRHLFQTVGLGAAVAGLATPAASTTAATSKESSVLVKEKDVIIYRNEKSYSHNACLARRADGELLCVLQEQKRRKYRTHVDPTSKTILLRSQDDGLTWDPSTKTTVVAGNNEAINDPDIVVLEDGTLIVNYFKWRCGTEEEAPLKSSGDKTAGGHKLRLVSRHVFEKIDRRRQDLGGGRSAAFQKRVRGDRFRPRH